MAAWEIQGRDAFASTSGVAGDVDLSGWNVNFGSGRIASDRTQTETDTTAGTLGALSSGTGGSYMPYLVLALAGLVAWRLTRKK